MLEREASAYHLPRAVALDGEGMRLVQTMGLAEQLLPLLSVSRNIRHVSADGKLLLLISRGGIGPEGWNHAYRFYQPEFEAVLRDGVKRFASVDVRMRCEAFALDDPAITSVFATRTSLPENSRRSPLTTSSVAMGRARRSGALWARRCRTCVRTNAGSCST